ncbi:MAG: flagellar motor protein [Nostoc sp.]
MIRRLRYSDYNEDLNIWPAFTDLMSNAFMILLLLLIVTTKYTVLQITNPGTPPILLIKDENSRFDPGSTLIPPTILDYIRNKLVPDIEKATRNYNINTVEIIGYTDKQPIGIINSNLDNNLEVAASQRVSVSTLKPGSNADLGLIRSLVVVKELIKIQQQNKMPGIRFRAYSAPQLILSSGEFAPVPQVNRHSEPNWRRIEIRFTRLGEVREVKSKGVIIQNLVFRILHILNIYLNPENFIDFHHCSNFHIIKPSCRKLPTKDVLQIDENGCKITN